MNLFQIFTINVYLLSSQGFPVPNQYNPSDHFIKTLAIIPGETESSVERINVLIYYSSNIFLSQGYL